MASRLLKDKGVKSFVKLQEKYKKNTISRSILVTGLSIMKALDI